MEPTRPLPADKYDPAKCRWHTVCRGRSGRNEQPVAFCFIVPQPVFSSCLHYSVTFDSE
jgi:hypothetical protein